MPVRNNARVKAMRLVFLLPVIAALSWAESSPCATKCNVQASECIKACTIDPKEAARPEKSRQMMRCMKSCEEHNAQCKLTC
jgi:hypothetical protein